MEVVTARVICLEGLVGGRGMRDEGGRVWMGFEAMMLTVVVVVVVTLGSADGVGARGLEGVGRQRIRALG